MFLLKQLFFFPIYTLNIFYKRNLTHINIILDYFQHQEQFGNHVFLLNKLNF